LTSTCSSSTTTSRRRSPAFQAAVREELNREGVEVRTGVTVEQATESAVEAADLVVPYDLFVWTGGIRGSDALGGERVDVRADLTLDDHTLAVGDAARVVDAEGRAVPASAQAAVREAKVAARNVERLVADRREARTASGRGWHVTRSTRPAGW